MSSEVSPRMKLAFRLLFFILLVMFSEVADRYNSGRLRNDHQAAIGEISPWDPGDVPPFIIDPAKTTWLLIKNMSQVNAENISTGAENNRPDLTLTEPVIPEAGIDIQREQAYSASLACGESLDINDPMNKIRHGFSGIDKSNWGGQENFDKYFNCVARNIDLLVLERHMPQEFKDAGISFDSFKEKLVLLLMIQISMESTGNEKAIGKAREPEQGLLQIKPSTHREALNYYTSRLGGASPFGTNSSLLNYDDNIKSAILVHLYNLDYNSSLIGKEYTSVAESNNELLFMQMFGIMYNRGINGGRTMIINGSYPSHFYSTKISGYYSGYAPNSSTSSLPQQILEKLAYNFRAPTKNGPVMPAVVALDGSRIPGFELGEDGNWVEV